MNINPFNIYNINYLGICVQVKALGQFIQSSTQETAGSSQDGKKLTYYLVNQTIKL